MKKRLTAAALVLASAGALIAFHTLRKLDDGGHGSHGSHQALAALAQTLLPVERGAPVAVPLLVTDDGLFFDPARLKGRWSLVFFGFTSCPDVCPLTLQVLSEFARHAASGVPALASGVPAGATQVVFVTVDPERDTPARLKGYLANFDERFIGLTGSRADLDRFAAQLGAGSEPSGPGGIDHSTSIFALDPQGRLAGVMLRPADPARIVADLNTLRAPRGAMHVSHAHAH
jgi:protein SCO1/2